MKDFIIGVYKNKKWITLGISILYLILFCFPITRYVESNGSGYNLPFIIFLIKFISIINKPISALKRGIPSKPVEKIVIRNITVNTICSILILACIVLAIIYIVRVFKNKKFYFTPSLCIAFMVAFISGIFVRGNNSRVVLNLPFTFYIFLILLILDIVYLVLEWYYVHDGQEKLSTLIAERKAVKQARQDAELKQSPEYRIEQLEKELQELKAKNDDKDGQ